MSDTAYGVNAPEARKAWSKALAYETLNKTYFGKFVGSDDESLIQEVGDLNKNKGDQVTITLRGLLQGRGTQGDQQLEGNEEALTTFTDKVTIDQRRHAASAGGKMSRQRVPFDTRKECATALADWGAEMLDYSFANQLTGKTNEQDTFYTGNNTPIAATRIIRPNALTTDQAVQGDNTAIFTTALIDRAKVKAKTNPKGTPNIRPIKVNGKNHYVMFLHDFQVHQLRQGGGTAGSWADIQKALIQGGSGMDNPIFSGALGMWNNVVLHEWDRLPNGFHSTTGADQTATRRAVLCGAQAMALAFGAGYSAEKFIWEEEVKDYGNKLGVGGGAIFGMKKTVYNNLDFGTVVVTTYSPDPNA